MQNAILTTMADWSTANAIKSAQNSQNEMIKNVGIGVVVVLVILIIVVILKRTPTQQNSDPELKDQLKELLEQNRKLADKVEQLEKESKKKNNK